MSPPEEFQESKEKEIERRLEIFYQRHESVLKSQCVLLSYLVKQLADLDEEIRVYNKNICKGDRSNPPLQDNLPLIDP